MRSLQNRFLPLLIMGLLSSVVWAQGDLNNNNNRLPGGLLVGGPVGLPPLPPPLANPPLANPRNPANDLQFRLFGLSEGEKNALRSGSEEGKALLKSILTIVNDFDINDAQSVEKAVASIMNAVLERTTPSSITPESAGSAAAMFAASLVEIAVERGADVSIVTQVTTNAVTDAFVSKFESGLEARFEIGPHGEIKRVMPDPTEVWKAVAAGAASGAVTAAANANLGEDVVANVAQAASAGVVESVGSSRMYSSLVGTVAASATQGAVNAASQTNQNVAAIAQSSTQGAAQGAANAGLSTQAINAVVLSAATSATETASNAGVTVTITDVSVESPTSSQSPVIITDDRPEVPDAPDNLVVTYNFTIMTINVAGQNVAISLTNAITDAVAVALTGNTVVGTQITSDNNTFDLSAIVAAVGAPLTPAQLNHLAEIIARALNIDIIASGSNNIIVSPSS